MKDVHTEHCCSRHGCKYGDSLCTVKSGWAPQSHMCEECYFEIFEKGGWETAHAMNETYEAGKKKVSDEVQAIIDEAFDKHTPSLAGWLAIRALNEYFGR